MKVALLTPTPPDINAFGLRTISAVLKREGFDTTLIFLPGGIQHLRFDGRYVYQYPAQALDRIVELCQGARLVGVSLMSQYFDRAVQVTEHIKRHVDAPVVWGGIHPLYRPEQCLEHADGVCVAEGEFAMVEMARKIEAGADYADTRSFWFKRGGGIVKNEVGPVVQDLDQLPFVDFDLKGHYVYDWRKEDVVPVDDAVMKEQFLRTPYFGHRNLVTYRTMTSRGCPHMCSYCASSAMKKLRRRSVDNVMAELKEVLGRFPYIEIISFFDDTFFAAPMAWFEEFRDRYKREVGLPFHAQCSPTTATRQKMDLLVDAGLFHTEMGIQSGSERIKKMYRRPESNEKILEAAALIDGYRAKTMPPYYHIILDNPWETAEDVKDTLRLVLRLPGKFTFSIASLILFPGTELNEKARQEGILKDELNEVCRKPFTFPKANYLNWLIFLVGIPSIPRWLLRLMAKDTFVNALHRDGDSRFFGLAFAATRKAQLLLKGMGALSRGDFGRIANYFRLAR